jgi:hypothetical protein
MCALQLLTIFGIALMVTPELTIDGYFTVDYYTTLLMITSGLVSITLRLWSPYSCRSVVYTRNLWATGKDMFFEFNKHTKVFEEKEFDLYDWMHVPAQMRARYLLHMCRGIGTGEVSRSYNEKGFIPDLEAEDQKEPGDTTHDTTVTDCICRVVFKSIDFVSYIFSPWRWHAKERAESNNQEKTNVITIAEVHLDWEVETWKMSKDGAPICDKKLYRVVVADSRKGEITRLSKTAGEVMVFFPKQADGCSVCFYMGEGDLIQRDANSNILNKAIPANSGDGWEFSMPMGSLRESSVEWAFTRKLLGEESMKKMLGA